MKSTFKFVKMWSFAVVTKRFMRLWKPLKSFIFFKILSNQTNYCLEYVDQTLKSLYFTARIKDDLRVISNLDVFLFLSRIYLKKFKTFSPG